MEPMKWNERLFSWLVENIFRHPRHMIFPRRIMALRWVLLPLSTLRWHLQRTDPVFRYDVQSDTFTLYGIRYAAYLFSAMAEKENIGKIFQIVSQEDGRITLRDIHPHIIHVNKGIRSLESVSVEICDTEDFYVFRVD